MFEIILLWQIYMLSSFWVQLEWFVNYCPVGQAPPRSHIFSIFTILPLWQESFLDYYLKNWALKFAPPSYLWREWIYTNFDTSIKEIKRICPELYFFIIYASIWVHFYSEKKLATRIADQKHIDLFLCLAA